MATEPSIFHLALRSDWESAMATGDYRVSTRGRSLEQEGYLHASFAHQVDRVRRRYYADVTQPLVLLEVDRALTGVPVVDEVPDGGNEAYPHVYGPLPVTAVVAVHDVV